MLERIALHQTRLHTPGLALDAKGIAIGAKGLVLLGSIDRMVALLAVYTRERSLEDLLPSLTMNAVKSKLGVREFTLEFAAESSDRMDRLAEVARLVGGFAFTGTSRHFVQYRDAGAPFGYDAPELLVTDASLSVYHSKFSQTYGVEHTLDLRSLLLRLRPRCEPSAPGDPGMRLLVTEPGLGPPLVQYFVRSRVDGEVCAIEWPPESAFDDTPVRRWLIRLPKLPMRMTALVRETPGITCFVPAGPGVAVEIGYRHPVELRACPIFDERGLVLLRGRGAPWAIERVPLMGALTMFAPVEMRTAGPDAVIATSVGEPQALRIALRVVRSSGPWRNVTAAWIDSKELPLLRRLAYVLPRATIDQASVAVTSRGAFVRCRAGIDAIPLGIFFAEVQRNLYITAGHEVTPDVAPEVLARALGAQGLRVVFLGADGRPLALEETAFVPLETMLLDAPPFEEVVAEQLSAALDEAPIDLQVG